MKKRYINITLAILMLCLVIFLGNPQSAYAASEETLQPAARMRTIIEFDLPTTQTAGITSGSIYTIKNTLSNYVMDIYMAYTAANTNVIQYRSTGNANQKFKLSYVCNGEYKIEPMHTTGMVLSLNSSKQLVIDTDTEADTKRWYIIESGINYNIVNKTYSSEFLSVNGSTTEGANIYSSTNSSGATWQIGSAVYPTTETAGITSGSIYTIKNILSNYVMDIYMAYTTANTSVIQYGSTGNANQKFRVSYVGNGEYKIEPMHTTGMVLSLNSSKRLVIDTDTSTSTKRWYIIESGSNYKFVNKAYSLEFLSVNGSTTSGAYIYSSTNTNGATWQMISVVCPTTETAGITSGGICTIKNTLSNYVMDVLNSGTAASTTVIQNGSTGVANQKFRLSYISNGEYKIEPMHTTGKVLSLNSSKQLMIDTDTNIPAKRWFIIESGSNYSIVNKAYSSEFLSVNGSTASGTNIYSSTNPSGADWQITLVVYTITYDGNGNTGGSAPASQSVPEGESIALSTNTGNLIKAGLCTLLGWNTTSGGTGDDYSLGQTITPTSDLTLYAKWSSPTYYTITYDGNGNTGGSAPEIQSVQAGQSIALRMNTGNLTKTGYILLGWNTNNAETGTDYSLGQTITPTSNLTLYARWSIPPVRLFYFDSGIPTNIPTIRNWFDNATYEAYSYFNTTSATVRSEIGDSQIVHVEDHGFPGGIWCTADSSLFASGSSYGNNVSLSDSYSSSGLPDCKFIFFAGCDTALYSETFGDLDDYAYYTLGVDATVAFSGHPKFTEGDPNKGWCLFVKNVYDYMLNSSYTLDQAVYQAKEDVKQVDGWDCDLYYTVVRGGDITF